MMAAHSLIQPEEISMNSIDRIRSLGTIALLGSSLLAACGGGDSGPAAAAAAVPVSGIAATGAAIANGVVTLKCVAGGTASATTGADGSFSVDAAGATLPCVARVDYKDGAGAAQKLHTFVLAPGTANITPVTDLIVSRLYGGTAADAFDKFDPTANKAITAVSIKAAADTVKAYLKNTLGVDTANLPDDPIGTRFTAKAGSTDGDKADKVLDDLQAKLKASGKKLGDAENDVAKSGAGDSTSPSGSSTLTVAAASKTSRNGVYAVVGGLFTDGTDFGFNGNTSNGLFETEVSLTAGGSVKQAHVWYFDGNNVIKFFGCDNKAVTCSGISYSAALKQITLSNVAWPEVTTSFGKASDVIVGGGETLTVNGTLSVAK